MSGSGFVRSVIAVLFCITLILQGCGYKDNGNNENESEIKKLFNSSIDKDYNNNVEYGTKIGTFTEKGINKYINNYDEQYDYVCYKEYLGKWIKDDEVQSIKYTLRNCVGGIYISEEDESNSNNFKVDKNFATKEDMINNNNKSLTVDSESQTSVYLKLYSYKEVNADDTDNDSIKECLKYMRISIEITYNDGSYKKRELVPQYKLSYGASPSNFELVQIIER